MPLSAAARTGLRVAQTGLWADHGSGLWVFRLRAQTAYRATARRGLDPLWGGRGRGGRGSRARGGGEEGRRGGSGGGVGGEEGQVHLQGLTLDLPQALWSCWRCRAVSNPLGSREAGVVRGVVRKDWQINVC